jgi:transcription elongation factor Elf1
VRLVPVRASQTDWPDVAEAGTGVGVLTVFDFSSRASRTAVKLSGSIPYIHPDVRPRVFQALEIGCYCSHDGERTATLTQRNGAAWLQCDTCGSSLGSAMSRTAHQKFDTYPVWRLDLIKQYEAAAEANRAALPTLEERQRAKEQAYIGRSIEYKAWCRSSREWAEIKKRIAWRSRGHCEACLAAPATVVHHQTYAFGRLPPAWHLRAVCDDCHERLHGRGDDWCDYGMARDQE